MPDSTQHSFGSKTHADGNLIMHCMTPLWKSYWCVFSYRDFTWLLTQCSSS